MSWLLAEITSWHQTAESSLPPSKTLCDRKNKNEKKLYKARQTQKCCQQNSDERNNEASSPLSLFRRSSSNKFSMELLSLLETLLFNLACIHLNRPDIGQILRFELLQVTAPSSNCHFIPFTNTKLTQQNVDFISKAVKLPMRGTKSDLVSTRHMIPYWFI